MTKRKSRSDRPTRASTPTSTSTPASAPVSAPASSPPGSSPKHPGAWHWGWSLVLGIVTLLTLFITFATPIYDGDLFWQMEYGRQMLENRTLVPDHTIYTWTPTDGSGIYCAWLSEIALYAMYQLGGLPLLFLFRYLCLLILVFCVWVYARQLGVATHPLTWFVCVLALLMSWQMVHIKPQMVSFVLMTLSVLAWRQIRLGGRHAVYWCYLLPLLMLLWVNSHGGFIFGLAFLVVMAIGEGLNARFSPKLALPPSILKHLCIALVVAGLTILITPYGWNYPVFLLRELLTASMSDLATVSEYATIFAARALPLRYVDYGVIAAGLLLVLGMSTMRKRRIDFAIILTNLVFAFLYARFIRLTFFWAPIFTFTTLALLAERPTWLYPKRKLAVWLIGGILILGSVGLSGRVIKQYYTHTYDYMWLGFGVSYFNPVEEANYIEANFSNYRLGNDYDTGGYLLWKLYPKMKVFIDPRYFPFRQWYGDYLKLITTNGINKLLERFPADVWCISLPYKKTVYWFNNSPEWVPAFYGAAAAVYVRKGIKLPAGRVQAGKEIDSIRNFTQAIEVFTFALNVRDWSGADRVVTGMEKISRTEGQHQSVADARQMLLGSRAYYKRDYETAITHLRSTRAGATFSTGPISLMANCYNFLAAKALNSNEHQKALEMARMALQIAPNDLNGVYNVGVIEWFLQQKERGNIPSASTAPNPGWQGTLAQNSSGTDTWKQHLQQFLKLAQGNRNIPARAVDVAKSILQGTAPGSIPLLVPPEPTLSS